MNKQRPILLFVILALATTANGKLFLSLKNEWLRRILVPLGRDELSRELSNYLWWFEHARPHQGLDGRTPQETPRVPEAHQP